jgi:hypothetical protein
MDDILNHDDLIKDDEWVLLQPKDYGKPLNVLGNLKDKYVQIIRFLYFGRNLYKSLIKLLWVRKAMPYLFPPDYCFPLFVIMLIVLTTTEYKRYNLYQD